MKKYLGDLVGIISGSLLMSFPIFFMENFSFHWLAGVFYKILAFGGLLIFLYFFCCLFRIKFRYGVIFLLFLELSIYVIFVLLKNDVNLPHFITARFQYVYKNRIRDAAPFNRELGRYDNDLFYKLKSGNHQFSNIEFTNQFSINSLGVRDDEKSLHFPKIICLGDSFTMGWGVEQEATFPSLIENQTQVNTLNLGIASYGTAREYLIFQKTKFDSCKLLIIQYCENDDVENREFIGNNFSLTISPQEKYIAAQNFNALRSSYFPFKYSFEFLGKIIRSIFRFKPSLPIPIFDKKQNTKDFFRILALIQKDFRGKIIIFNLESYSTSDLVYKNFKEYLGLFPNQNIILFNASEVLGKEDYYRIDDHIKTSGHKKIATGIINLIYEHQLLD